MSLSSSCFIISRECRSSKVFGGLVDGDIQWLEAVGSAGREQANANAVCFQKLDCSLHFV